MQWCRHEWAIPRTLWCSILRQRRCISPQKWRAGLQETWLGTALFTAPSPSSSLPTRGLLRRTAWCIWMAATGPWHRWTWAPWPCPACPCLQIRNTADISTWGTTGTSLSRRHCTRISRKNHCSRYSSLKKGTALLSVKGSPRDVTWAGMKVKVKRSIYLCLMVFKSELVSAFCLIGMWFWMVSVLLITKLLSLLCAWLSSFSNKCKWARGHQRNQEMKMFSLVVILDEGLSPGLLSVFVSLSSSSVLSLCSVDLAILSSPFMIVSSCSVTVGGLGTFS